MTATSATFAPGPPGPGADATASDFTRWETQVARTGYCTRPVRLHGRIDAIDLAAGEMRPVYTTDGEPGGVLKYVNILGPTFRSVSREVAGAR